MFYADLHVHSRFFRATSPSLNLQNLVLWAARKDIKVVGTGDVTHPEWFAELKQNLTPAEPGLFRLKKGIQRQVDEVNRTRALVTRFMLQAEISTIYKKDGKVRKVHHLIYAPSFAAARKINQKLGRIGNLALDGRPILGIDSTLVVLMTEFGRTQKINGAAGRDHYPNCYSVVFAGAGVKGGHVHGESNSIGVVPLLGACKPADLHATIFSAMNIDPQLIMYDFNKRPLPICDGLPLPLFS